jgi:electron transport complex protein RnfG
MKRWLTTGLTLAAIAAVCVTIVAATYRLTATRIADNRLAFLESQLAPALGTVDYDTRPAGDAITLMAPHGLPGNEPATIYRVYRDGQPAAALFAVSARNGYAGPIRVLIGIDAAGAVTGVRILEHEETPGLGDGIEASRSDWIEQFAGRSLGDPPVESWSVRADGGRFDQLTGATITPRAVVGAIRDTLVYFEANRDTVFSRPGSSE